MEWKEDAGKLMATALILGLLAGGSVGCTDRESEARVSAVKTTLEPGRSGPVDRSLRPEVRFEVELDHAPVGSTLDLRCEWRGPLGDIRHQNRWQTRKIDREVWPTHCRKKFDAKDPAGPWSVLMTLGERALATERFSVE